MAPSKVKYKFMEGYECLDYYIPGGYHPVMLGDRFCSGRYRFVDKLGFGRNATSWLAEDTLQTTPRLVALKISTAESAQRTSEIEILSRLGNAQSDLPGKAFVQTLRDSFRFNGPNGTHQCLVTDFERISLNELKEVPFHRLLPLPAAKAMAAQLVLGVQFIHSLGIVHGDIHAGNILLQLTPDMQNISIDKLRPIIGEPMKESVVREDGAPLDAGVPREVIMPIWLGVDSDRLTLSDAAIKLADFGEAFDPQKTKCWFARTPVPVAPPESRFAEDLGEPLSFPGDIWTLGCALWDIIGCKPPFESLGSPLDGITKDHVEMLGKLPQRWWELWDEERMKWFDENGRKTVREDLRQWHGTTHWTWDDRFAEYIQTTRQKQGVGPLSTDEERDFRQMMNMMLVLEPGERATVNEIVGCDWMQRWGLPELKRMKQPLNQTSQLQNGVASRGTPVALQGRD